MKIAQGQFSFLPDLSDVEITLQVEYALDKGWAIGSYSTTAAPRPAAAL